MDVLTKSIIFVGGKGGVGKSTSAAAIAWKSAKEGNKTLLISTDPAHNVGDIFNREIGGKTIEIADNLFALEIDPEIETDNYIKGVKANIKGTVHFLHHARVDRPFDVCLHPFDVIIRKSKRIITSKG